MTKKGYWKCDNCGHIEQKEAEVICWNCGKGEMGYWSDGETAAERKARGEIGEALQSGLRRRGLFGGQP